MAGCWRVPYMCTCTAVYVSPDNFCSRAASRLQASETYYYYMRARAIPSWCARHVVVRGLALARRRPRGRELEHRGPAAAGARAGPARALR